MPSVFNKHHKTYPYDAVYVGRPTKWGNPFSHLHGAGTYKTDTREEAVAMYTEWLLNTQHELVRAAKAELKGRDLVCWCAPLACHADVLLNIANSEEN